MILPCTCTHKAQDELHGKNMRVHNWARSANNKSGGYRCTVCGVIKKGERPVESKKDK